MGTRLAIDLMTGVREAFDAASRGEPPQLAWWPGSPLAAVSVTVGAFGEPPFSYSNAVRDLAVWQALFDHERCVLAKVRTSGDLDRLPQAGRLGVILNLQNAAPVNGPLENLYTLFNLGVRQIQLTYNDRNLIGDGCLERANAGLSRLGGQLIATLNNLGVAIDVSHCGHRTTLDAVAASARPLMASHTGAWRLHAHPRNKTDEELKAIAEARGVIGICAVPFFLADRAATIDTLIDHVAYVAEKVGIEHVAIGSDRPDHDPNEASRDTWEAFWHGQAFAAAHDPAIGACWPPFVEAFRYLRDWPRLLDALSSRGFDAAAIAAVAGDNARRFFQDVLPRDERSRTSAAAEFIQPVFAEADAGGRA